MNAPRTGLQILVRAPEVEASLWRRMREEDDGACREQLFELYLPLARAVAGAERRRRPADGLDRADFEQLAFSGLLEAIDRYDPLRGAPFEAFARPRIRGAIADGASRSSERAALYSARRRAERERLSSLLAGSELKADDAIAELAALATTLAIGIIAESAALDVADTAAPDAYEGIAWREMQLAVIREINALKAAEKTVVQQHYLNSVPFVEIARLLGVSKGRVAQIHRAALMRLRERLRRMD